MRLSLLFELLELEGVSLWLTSWLSSIATSKLRAACRAAARLVIRHGPVSGKGVIYFEVLGCPEIPNVYPEDASQQRNLYSPLRSWSLQLTDCGQLLHRDASDFCRAIGSRLFRDRDFVLALAAKSGYAALKFADEGFRRDREVVLAAVTQDGEALLFADETFRSDRDVVLAAFTQDGDIFDIVDRSLQRDRDVVLAAATSHGYRALLYADESLRNDPQVIARCDMAAATRTDHQHALRPGGLTYL